MRLFLNKISFRYHKIFVFLYIRFKFFLGNPWVLVDIVQMPLFKEIGFNTLRWIVNGQYEIGELNIVKHTIEQQDIVMEIGTGLGFISTFCAKVTSSSQVFTFEANPLNYETSKLVFEKNKVSPSMRNCFLSNEVGYIDFPVNKKNRLASSTLNNNETIQIEKIDLNNTIKKINPNYLIMDIEGSEYDIFKIIDFHTIKKIQFELHPKILDDSKCNFIFNILKSNGFEMDLLHSVEPNYFFKKVN